MIVAKEAASTVAPLDVAEPGAVEAPDAAALFGDDEPEVAAIIAAITIPARTIAIPATRIGLLRLRSATPA